MGPVQFRIYTAEQSTQARGGSAELTASVAAGLRDQKPASACSRKQPGGGGTSASRGAGWCPRPPGQAGRSPRADGRRGWWSGSGSRQSRARWGHPTLRVGGCMRGASGWPRQGAGRKATGSRQRQQAWDGQVGGCVAYTSRPVAVRTASFPLIAGEPLHRLVDPGAKRRHIRYHICSSRRGRKGLGGGLRGGMLGGVQQHHCSSMPPQTPLPHICMWSSTAMPPKLSPSSSSGGGSHDPRPQRLGP